ncbi:multiple sugar transport system permease protein [Kaistia hirudinis]|uniref:Multiple sugar transport system permease protein n=1 Tax=Kaistia hirudinis TaxID=1293440 RepID=A0A840AJI2_9HYPH|nr:sugar ABC transporter permease [Kaistia hirudinis]MBB3929294.1 multiple sugar transport system permease protein [Kaistia hirudinis]MBN9018681.1 sugar ABC transporter permease [Hyphomicrobiales bacterium]
MERQTIFEGRVLLAPLTAFLIALLGFPLVVDLVYSVSRVGFENIRAPEITGLGNYAKALADPEFWGAAWFSLRFGLIVASIQVVVGLILAIFLAPLFAARPWLIALLMLPMMVAPALVGLMYRLILHEFVGAVPYYLLEWYGDFPAFLGRQWVFTTLVVIETLQWTPFALLILHSAYAAISPDVREAASLDGATGLRLFLNVDLPLMLPAIGITAFIRFIDSFRVFDNLYTLVGSGAGGSTTSMSIYIYQAFFKVGDIGLAVAASMLLLAASFVVLWIINHFTARKVAT